MKKESSYPQQVKMVNVMYCNIENNNYCRSNVCSERREIHIASFDFLYHIDNRYHAASDGVLTLFKYIKMFVLQLLSS